MDHQKVNRVTREIRVKLTAKQLNDRRDEAADHQAKMDETTRELAKLTESYKEVKKEHDEEITRCSSFISRTLREIKEKKATITTEVDEVRNYEDRTVEYWHPNFEHGEMVDSRPMNTDEHQAVLIGQKVESIPQSGMEVSECVN